MLVVYLSTIRSLLLQRRNHCGGVAQLDTPPPTLAPLTLHFRLLLLFMFEFELLHICTGKIP